MAKEEEYGFLDILNDNEIPSSSLQEVTENEDKSTKKRQKTLLECVVCGDAAYGYNFDAISCESCKAFFRRNALRSPGKLKCRGHGHCEVTVESRKRCKKCRLDKCFRMGMRKEWILSDEQKKKKKSKIEENRRLKQPQDTSQQCSRRSQTNSKTDDSSSGDGLSPQFTIDDIPGYGSLPQIATDTISLMTESDWSKIQQVQTVYKEAIELNKVIGVPLYPATHSIHSTLDLIRIPTYLASIRLITYIKKNPEFQLFNADDRTTLVKHNLLAVVFMHTVLIYNPIADMYHEHNTEDPIFQGKDWIEILGEEFYHDITTTAINLIKFLEYDRVIVKILLLIILYTKGFCGYDIIHEPSLNDISIVLKTQNMYVDILYKYCLHQYGFKRTITLFTNLINQLFSIQRLAIHLKNLVHTNIDGSQLSPLMQSVLQLTDWTSSS